MIGRALLAGVILAVWGVSGCAGPPERSARPEARGAPNAEAVARSMRPEPKPGARRTVLATSAAGSVCGDPTIRGAAIAPVAGRLPGCGVADPVRISAVAGVTLSQPSVMDCPTARALRTWVEGGVKPAVGNLGGGVSELRVAAHYVCRTRNHKPGGRISEHGKGRAIDISALVLENDAAITVARGWRDPAQGPVLRRVHRAACGPFGTVLGPESDRYHQAHFHLDTARYRSGPFCR